MQGILRKDAKGVKAPYTVHGAGESVKLGYAELWLHVKLEEHEIRLPQSCFRFECAVPECTEDREYVAPGDWCAKHWSAWSDLNREGNEEPPWMADPDRHSPTVTFQHNLTDQDFTIPKGTVVEVLEEYLMIHVFIGEWGALVDRRGLNIECEHEGCTKEAGTWDPKYHCKEHHLAYTESMPPRADIGILGEWDPEGRIDISFTDKPVWAKAELDPETEEPPEGTLMRIVEMRGNTAVVEVM